MKIPTKARQYLNFIKSEGHSDFGDETYYLNDRDLALAYIEMCRDVLEKQKDTLPECFEYLRSALELIDSSGENDEIKDSLLNAFKLKRNSMAKNKQNKLFRDSALIDDYINGLPVSREDGVDLVSKYDLNRVHIQRILKSNKAYIDYCKNKSK